MTTKRPCTLCHGTNYPSRYSNCPLCRDDDDETEDEKDEIESDEEE